MDFLVKAGLSLELLNATSESFRKEIVNCLQSKDVEFLELKDKHEKFKVNLGMQVEW